MRIGTLIGTGVLILAILFVGANGYLPVPEPIRNLWDRNYERNVEPAKEKWDDLKRQVETTAPRADLGAPAFSIPCTVPVCAA